tara:strand:- start:366 stop:533 length:168 start_codon:yes stop_codon:yes gene_type:complete
MPVDVAAVCARADELAGVQLLTVVLTSLFAAYILIDSALVGYVICRKVEEAGKRP